MYTMCKGAAEKFYLQSIVMLITIMKNIGRNKINDVLVVLSHQIASCTSWFPASQCDDGRWAVQKNKRKRIDCTQQTDSSISRTKFMQMMPYVVCNEYILVILKSMTRKIDSSSRFDLFPLELLLLRRKRRIVANL